MVKKLEVTGGSISCGGVSLTEDELALMGRMLEFGPDEKFEGYTPEMMVPIPMGLNTDSHLVHRLQASEQIKCPPGTVIDISGILSRLRSIGATTVAEKENCLRFYRAYCDFEWHYKVHQLDTLVTN